MRNVMLGAGLIAALLVGGCARQAAQDDELKKKVEELDKKLGDATKKLDDMKRNPAMTAIVLSKTGDTCDTAKVLHNRVGNYHERHVHWQIVDTCDLGVFWELELEFAPKGGDFPFATEKVKSKGTVFKFVNEKIKKSGEVKADVYTYKINLLRGGTSKTLSDPELEVEPPPVIVATAGAPAPPPPAKKQ